MSDTQATSSPGPTESTAGTLALAKQAARQGAADASEAAARTLAAAGQFVNRLVYSTCYSTSYGIVFPAVLLARCVPVNNAAVRGLIDGADAARRRVDEVYQPDAGLTAPALAPA
jgi:hypothetical protein